MKKALYQVFITMLSLFAGELHAQQVNLGKVDWQALDKTHDINLSPWGPYSKKYAGISHIPSIQKGLKFEFSVMPGLYRYKTIVPNVLFQSDYYPWRASDDMSAYTFRNEMVWKNEIYTDVTYHIVDSNTVLVAMHCVNNSKLPQHLDLNLMGYIEYPESYPSKKVTMPDGSTWINAIHYQQLNLKQKSIRDNLIYDGYLKGEVRNSDYIEGRALGALFSKDEGSTAVYKLNISKNQLQGTINLVYRIKKGAKSSFRMRGLADTTVQLQGTGALEIASISYKKPSAGATQLTIETLSKEEVEFNGLAITPGLPGSVKIDAVEKYYVPQVTENPEGKSVILKYKDIDQYYGISWEFDQFRIREFKNDELDIFLKRNTNNHTYKVFNGNNSGDFSNVYLRPIELEAKAERTVYALVASGSLDKVKRRLQQLTEVKQVIQKKAPVAGVPKILPQGEKYRQSQEIFRALVLTNMAYPIYTQDAFIRHFSPGKFYNSLYTWDSGFSALGLVYVNPEKAMESINTYTTEKGNDNAFIQHGTPIPVQIYAFMELWNKTQSKEMLAYFYPRLKKYYEFIAGRYGSSNTRSLKSGLLKTWDYFYNSGGWDDYPAQVTVHNLKVESTVAPVATTAHAIRIAKMLKLAAAALGEKADLKLYEDDIALFSKSLQKNSWNDTSGYFSYVVHNAEGNPVGHFKYPGTNLDHNMGLDGVTPLIAGICTPVQEKAMINDIFSDKHMWTPAGICAVDKSAPYFNPVGYWNGSIWMPHQWFIWKTMLDIGRPDLARQIATKALDIFGREVDETYSSFEYYVVKNGRGAGWHQFTSLSSPVLSWFASYYKPGTITSGFEIWINKQSFNTNNTNYTAQLSFDSSTPAHKRCFMVCLNPAFKYRVLINGKVSAFNSPYAGLLEIGLPATNTDLSIRIQPVK
ncbi:MGH1-like glycoside hydrolase domain-containing protein [Mucilaginibacter boryungensis]|uniref:Glycoside hydrolase n=1 Tax=Mucilaginibacter boryungensis TaxID=768480 RepID=A0ABR9XDM0_9SPHI|nr:trehalase family glycosidase [Mucilaginibacter boryungensis]MBE9665493.1 glycoside hydrolase [Mucilaginibacter boryungensis]